jgi:hypothetical protein
MVLNPFAGAELFDLCPLELTMQGIMILKE